ncbi:collagen alpha-2(V) chain-like [Neocloeon triangulifer]|uniref:collagen alpha-2(V) chain-like n=1 Tax=Neocloeon triangulifer TaxID=2078957 RepID=UPI00286EFF10|nr:collagen alpha-2(V) chain-like [Neocloeon triangulifer]
MFSGCWFAQIYDGRGKYGIGKSAFCVAMKVSILTLLISTIIATKFVDAANSNGRFKYIKKPVSKYRVKDDPADEHVASGEEREAPAKDGAPVTPGEDGVSAQPEERSPDLAGEQGPPSDTPPPAQEEANRDPLQEIVPSSEGETPGNEEGKTGEAAPGGENPASGAEPAEDGAPNSEGQQGGNDGDTPRKNENDGNNPGEGGNPGEVDFSTEGARSASTFVYTNEMGEPVTSYTTPTPSVYSFRRTTATIINGRRIKVMTNRRGWNRQSLVGSGD